MTRNEVFAAMLGGIPAAMVGAVVAGMVEAILGRKKRRADLKAVKDASTDRTEKQVLEAIQPLLGSELLDEKLKVFESQGIPRPKLLELAKRAYQNHKRYGPLNANRKVDKQKKRLHW